MKSTISISTPEGVQVLGSPLASDSFLAPLTSLSPEVTRGALVRGEFQVRLSTPGKPPEVSVTALLHGRDEFVILDGSRPVVVKGSTAPRAARSGGANASWDLGHLIRRDGHCVRGGRVVLTPPEAGQVSTLLLFGPPSRAPESPSDLGWRMAVEGVEAFLRADPLRPLVLDSDGTELTIDLTLELEGGSFDLATEAPLDAAMFVQQVKPRKVAALTPRGNDASKLAFAMPEGLAEALELPGIGMTLFLHVDSAEKQPNREAPFRGDPARTPGAALVDATRESGIDVVHFEGAAEQLDIRPTMGPGAAWGDVDGDGWLDLVILQGAGRPGTDPLPDRLYRGLRGGRFEDITLAAGLGRGDAGMGALFVDVDGDGHLDLYCANYGPDRLYLGKGNGAFTEATELLPKLDLWSASVTAADADGDGDLDLYITSYLEYDLEKMPPAEELGRYQREDPVEMLPFAFPGQRNVYLRNLLAERGELAFEDATEALGLLDVQGRGMQSVFWDFDQDGDEDLYVANDVSFNVLFRNEGDGTFKDVSFSTGLDDPRGGMGLAVGDVDRDGDEDVFLTNWELEANALYLNSVVSDRSSKRRRASFHDYTVRSGLGPSGIGKTSWGAELFDLDLDGDLDLYVANGYTSPDYESTGICVGQTDQLFLGDGTGKFRLADPLPPAVTTIAQSSRGAIGADHDQDGDVDLLVTSNNGRVILLRNDSPRLGEWKGIRLRQPGLNPYAIGATVTIKLTNDETHRQSLRAGQGYLTGNAPELHFGLGKATAIDSIEVTWPGGQKTTHEAPLNTWQTLTR
ncbi:FG-GAP repeat protein [Planctomycetes bacterium Poly30]|uniref:FG-GAP repeat protein n=1 Tax=Saltatorellus ferox TaxID=2528018 RepID=A0A518EQC0_9BACT|nr:FG-GAP repeat protein [Planctomycetes bacterium Poly30]